MIISIVGRDPVNTKAELSPIEVSPQQSELIQKYGLFMVAWSVLESVIQAAIMKELGIEPEKSVIVTGKLQFYPRVQLLCSLLKLKGDTHKEAIKLLNKIEGAAHRNTLVHGLVIVGDPERFTFVKYDGGASVKQSFTPYDMHQNIMDLSEKTNNLQDLLNISQGDIQLIGEATLAACK
jgi:hypothetical protein